MVPHKKVAAPKSSLKRTPAESDEDSVKRVKLEDEPSKDPRAEDTEPAPELKSVEEAEGVAPAPVDAKPALGLDPPLPAWVMEPVAFDLVSAVNAVQEFPVTDEAISAVLFGTPPGVPKCSSNSTASALA